MPQPTTEGQILTPDAIAELRSLVELRSAVPLAPLTSWRVGGSALWLCEPDAATLPKVLRLARECDIPVVYLGRGSNVLVADDGIRGLVISTRRTMRGLRRDGDVLEAEAGVALPKLSRAAADLGFGGYEFLIGVPGTVGAGTAINAGLTAHEVRDVAGLFLDADVVTQQGAVERWDADRFRFRYRGSAALDEDAFILRARFALRDRRDAATTRRVTAGHLAERRRKQPLARPTAGSTFKQPDGGHPAGWYVDRAGLKGTRVGGAVVSEKHANWIETRSGATASDVRELIAHVEEEVERYFDVRLEREVRYLPEDDPHVVP